MKHGGSLTGLAACFERKQQGAPTGATTFSIISSIADVVLPSCDGDSAHTIECASDRCAQTPKTPQSSGAEFVRKLQPGQRKAARATCRFARGPRDTNTSDLRAITIMIYSWRGNPRNQVFDTGRATLSLRNSAIQFLFTPLPIEGRGYLRKRLTPFRRYIRTTDLRQRCMPMSCYVPAATGLFVLQRN